MPGFARDSLLVEIDESAVDILKEHGQIKVQHQTEDMVVVIQTCEFSEGGAELPDRGVE